MVANKRDILLAIKEKKSAIFDLNSEILVLQAKLIDIDNNKSERESQIDDKIRPKDHLRPPVNGKDDDTISKNSVIIVKPSFIPRHLSSEEVHKEHLSKFRIYDRKVTHVEMESKMINRKFIPLAEISALMSNEDIPGNWVTVGIICNKVSPQPTKDGEVLCCIDLTDLCNNMCRVFLLEKVSKKHKNLSIGSIIAVLNPTIILPNERAASLGLILDHHNKIMEIGTSADLAFCKSTPLDKRTCYRSIDRRLGVHCAEHSAKVITQVRSNRQEFALNTSLFHIGNPTTKVDPTLRKYETNATYRLGAMLIVADGIKIRSKSPPRPTSQRPKSKREEETLYCPRIT